jgi:sec-independent protein translocase protein TatA
MNLGGSEILLLVLIVLLLFGAARLPKLARSMREARDEFQKGNPPASPDAPLAQEAPPPDADKSS